MLATEELRGFSMVVRDNSAELCFLFNFADIRWPKINIENLVANLFALMGSREIVMRQPFAIDMIKMLKAQADKVIKTLRLYGRDVRFGVSIRLWCAWRSKNYFSARNFPERVKAGRKFSIAVADQMLRLNTNIFQPHGRITCLLEYPFFIGVERRRSHENATAAKVDEHEDKSIDLSLPRQDGLAEKIDGDESLDMGSDESRPSAVRVLRGLVRHWIDAVSLHDVPDSCPTDFDAQLFEFPMDSFVSPAKVLFGKPENQLDGFRVRFGTTTLAFRPFARLLPQPFSVGGWLNHRNQIINVMTEQPASAYQSLPFLGSRNNSRFINPVAEHFVLFLQKLHPRIVARQEKPRDEKENHLQKPRFLFQITQNENPLKLLSIINLQRKTPFRTPMKTVKRKKIRERMESSHPKAGFWVRFAIQLGAGRTAIQPFFAFRIAIN